MSSDHLTQSQGLNLYWRVNIPFPILTKQIFAFFLQKGFTYSQQVSKNLSLKKVLDMEITEFKMLATLGSF